MSSFGHVRDMMARYAANRELLQAKRKRHFRKSKLYEKVCNSESSIQLKELNKAEWERVKNRIRQDRKWEIKLWVVVSIAVVVSLLWVIKAYF
jgi:hypothetical protein